MYDALRCHYKQAEWMVAALHRSVASGFKPDATERCSATDSLVAFWRLQHNANNGIAPNKK